MAVCVLEMWGVQRGLQDCTRLCVDCAACAEMACMSFYKKEPREPISRAYSWLYFLLQLYNILDIRISQSEKTPGLRANRVPNMELVCPLPVELRCGTPGTGLPAQEAHSVWLWGFFGSWFFHYPDMVGFSLQSLSSERPWHSLLAFLA